MLYTRHLNARRRLDATRGLFWVETDSFLSGTGVSRRYRLKFPRATQFGLDSCFLRL